MGRVATGIVIVLALALILSGCAPAPAGTPPAAGETPPAVGETPPAIGETPGVTEAITPEVTEEATEEPAEEATPEATEEMTPEATEEATPEATAEVTPEATEPTELPSTGTVPTVDGTIGEDEYPNTTTINAIQVWWFNDGESLSVALQAPTDGWVGIGLDPETMMMGADFKLGAVLEGGETRVTDAFGIGPSGPVHPPDEELGGTDDIEESMVVTEDSVTRFEFRIPLDSGDENDKPLEPGNTYPIIVAYGPSDEYNAYHAFCQMGEITLDPAP